MKKKNIVLLIAITLTVFVGKAQTNNWLETAIQTAETQLKEASQNYTPGQNPRSINKDGTVRFAPERDWTCGFFPGNLWLMYELTEDEYFKNQAARFTEALDTVQYFTHTHDLGFMLYCSYGNAYRLTGNEKYKAVLQQGMESLATRYNPNVGCLRSWDFGPWQFPVIVDNMMNLEFVYWAGKTFHNKNYIDIAISHANKTLKNHFRKDYSSYHVVSYDTITGKALQHETHQGYSHGSAWSRGQAWGLYGYTMMYRNTKNKAYLKQAKKIAAFILKHPRLPKDMVPYWDFDCPKIPDSPRDASAAAVTASALLELSTYVKNGSDYYNAAEAMLKSLSSEKYLAKKGESAFFILKHSTGALPNNSEIDTPLNYGDYYFLEALNRYKALKEQ